MSTSSTPSTSTTPSYVFSTAPMLHVKDSSAAVPILNPLFFPQHLCNPSIEFTNGGSIGDNGGDKLSEQTIRSRIEGYKETIKDEPASSASSSLPSESLPHAPEPGTLYFYITDYFEIMKACYFPQYDSDRIHFLSGNFFLTETEAQNRIDEFLDSLPEERRRDLSYYISL